MNLEEQIIRNPDSSFDVSSLTTHVNMSKKECKEILKTNLEKLNELQEKLYSEKKHSVLFVFQAMDAAGKDSTIRAVFSGMNPQGFKVSSFKQPSKEELAHDYMWRVNNALPQRGIIGVFNRSHYEEVLVTRVHPQYILYQNIPAVSSLDQVNDDFWEKRLTHIANYEQYLSEQGYLIMKFFLNVSREEQKNRFLSRMETPEKNWKFSLGDMKERQLWEKYMEAYSKAISRTSTADAPWIVVPADDKDYLRASVSSHVCHALENLGLNYPESDASVSEDIQEAYRIFDTEKN